MHRAVNSVTEGAYHAKPVVSWDFKFDWTPCQAVRCVRERCKSLNFNVIAAFIYTGCVMYKLNVPCHHVLNCPRQLTLKMQKRKVSPPPLQPNSTVYFDGASYAPTPPLCNQLPLYPIITKETLTTPSKLPVMLDAEY